MTFALIGIGIMVLITSIYFLMGWNERRLGTIQLYPQQASRYDLPALSTLNDLLEAGEISISDDQLVFINGSLAELSDFLPPDAIIEVKTLKFITISVDEVEQEWQTFEPTVTKVLNELKIVLKSEDFLAPQGSTQISNGMRINILRAQPVKAVIDGYMIEGYSYEKSAEGILADLGIKPLGNDKVELTSSQDGTRIITVTTANETVGFRFDFKPFGVKQEYSPELEAGGSQIKQAGQPGVTLRGERNLIFSTDESRTSSVGPIEISQPTEQINLVSNQSGSFTLTTELGDLEYWKVLEMYTTSYSPCNSGIAGCSYGTASGLPAGYGVVAVTRSVFNVLNGTEVFIPGYGRAVIGDIGGGFPDGRPWIDLGYADENYVGWYGYHTVYFLGPAPAFDPF